MTQIYTWVGQVHPWVGLGPAVNFSEFFSIILLSRCHRHQITTVGKQSGSSRASLMAMQDGMKTHRWLRKLNYLPYVHFDAAYSCWF